MKGEFYACASLMPAHMWNCSVLKKSTWKKKKTYSSLLSSLCSLQAAIGSTQWLEGWTDNWTACRFVLLPRVPDCMFTFTDIHWHVFIDYFLCLCLMSFTSWHLLSMLQMCLSSFCRSYFFHFLTVGCQRKWSSCHSEGSTIQTFYKQYVKSKFLHLKHMFTFNLLKHL